MISKAPLLYDGIVLLSFLNVNRENKNISLETKKSLQIQKVVISLRRFEKLKNNMK